MTELMKMDIFFFITTIVVAVAGIFLAMILFRIWRILSHVEALSRNVSEESALMRQDIAQARMNMKIEGFKIKYLLTLAKKSVKHFLKLSK